MVRKAEKSVKSVNESVGNDRDPLLVQSVEKAFRVLRAFDGSRPTLSLSQIAEETGLDISAAQRFTYTLTKLGYLTKSSAPDQLVDAVHRVAAGERPLSDDIAGLAGEGDPKALPHMRLSPREFDLFRLLVRGIALEDIAAQLYLSTKTIANYQTLIRKKLGLANVVEMYRYAREHGLD